MEPSTVELILFTFANSVPFLPILLYPFRNNMRYSKRTNLLLLISFLLFQSALIIFEFKSPSRIASYCSFLSTLLNIVYLFAVVKASRGRIVFNLLMISNIGNFVVVAAKCIENIFFPQYVLGIYCWTFSLCMIVVEILSLIPLWFYIKRYSPDSYNNSSFGNKIWAYVWIIPATFYVIWFYLFYYASEKSSLQMAMEPKNTFFLLFMIIGQLITYLCISKMISHYTELKLLEEEKHHAAQQQLQYRNIQNNIKEIRVIFHDFRHHVNLMNMYLEQNKLDALKTHLNELSTTLMEVPKLHFCKHTSLNMLLIYYAQLYKMHNIEFDCLASVPEELPLSDIDVSVLFGNLLENAFHACKEYPAERSVRFRGAEQGGKLIFTIDNTFSNTICKDSNDNFISTKTDGSGIGTVSAKEIVQKYNGSIHFETRDNYFCVSILI